MIALPDSARNDAKSFWNQLWLVHDQAGRFGLPEDPDLRERLHAIMQVRHSQTGAEFTNAQIFLERVQALHSAHAQFTRDHHTLRARGFDLLERSDARALDERFLKLAGATSPEQAALNDDGQTTNPEARAELAQIAADWDALDHPDLAAQMAAAQRSLPIEWLPQDDFETHWINRILASEAFARQTAYHAQEAGYSHSNFGTEIWNGLQAVGVRWYFDVWSFVIGGDGRGAKLGLTRDGLRVFRFDERRDGPGWVLSWPELEELHQIVPRQLPPSSSELNLRKFDAALARVLPLQESLDRRVGGTLAGLIAAFLRPASTYRMFLTLGGWGMSDLTLLRHVITACLAVVGLWAALDYADAPGWAAILTDPDRPTSLRLRALVPVVSTLLLCVAGPASLIRATALLHGTLLRALGRPPVDGTTNLPGTGKSNFILRLFGHKP